MADPGTQATRRAPEILSGSAIPFRFDVTWRSLAAPLRPTGASPAVVPRPARHALPADAEAKEWEMVLPRMRRPAALAALPSPAEAASPPIPLEAPHFATAPERDSRRWLFLAAGAVVVGLAFVGYRSTQATPPEAEVKATEMGGAGWVTEWASDATGSARGRQISLYRPSLTMSDYRLEFLGRVERKSLGWVFRAVDSRNYYAGKLEATPAGLAITHFAVVKGAEGPHIQRPVTVLLGFGSPAKVRLDAAGPRFTVYVQDQVVEDWEDDRLRSGGVGFLNEREERGEVNSVRISFPKGGRQ